MGEMVSCLSGPGHICTYNKKLDSGFFHNLNWDSVKYLAGKSTEQFQSELLIRQVMTTCKTSEGSTWQLGKPGICQLTEFRTN